MQLIALTELDVTEEGRRGLKQSRRCLSFTSTTTTVATVGHRGRQIVELVIGNCTSAKVTAMSHNITIIIFRLYRLSIVCTVKETKKAFFNFCFGHIKVNRPIIEQYCVVSIGEQIMLLLSRA
ncbi:hypothetical protein TYRP_022661 [Tyrophagus putrescentiae]|nr:hypothetical protein TYRP_022661 [Tyrophagus putrescentiae]